MSETVTLGLKMASMSSIEMNDEAVSSSLRGYSSPENDRSVTLRAGLRVKKFVLPTKTSRIAGYRRAYSNRSAGPPLSRDRFDEWWTHFAEELVEDDTEREYAKQIADLREEAEEESIEINERSVSSFWSFVETVSVAKVGDVFFTGSGDLSAEWRTGPDNHFELRFLGGNRVNYVYFKKHSGEADVSSGYGTEPVSRVSQLVDSFGFGPLIYS